MQRGTYFGIILLSALALIAAAGAQAGDPTVIWNRTYGGPDAGDAAYAIVPDPGGAGFFLAGETTSSGEGKTDAWVIRLTPEGTEEWNRTYGGEETDTARSIIRTGDGNLLFAGNLTLVTNGTRPDTDAWIVKIEPSGGEVWNRTYGGPDVNASANAVTGTDDGGYLFVGSIAPRGGNESAAWAVRLNETGDEVWSRTFGGANDTANAVTRLPGGDFAVAGSTESSGAGMADVWVVRLNESGDEVWNRTFGSPDDDAGRAVINTSDGNLLVAGTFTERPDNATVDTDALLIKLTPGGDIAWNWIYGDFGVDESAAAVIETGDGGYLFAGETGFPGVDDTDAWLVGTDAEGAVAWSRTFGGRNPGDRAASVLEIAPEEHIFAGTFNATERGGPNTDAWAVRLGPAPEPTPTATPTPVPTVAPIKPPKAPVVPQKPPVTATLVLTTPTVVVTVPIATATETPVPTVTAVPIETRTPKPTKTAKPTKEPTMTPTPTPTPEPTQTQMPTEKPDNHDDDDLNDDDDRNDTGNSRSLSGTVWYDLNADGIPDPGEPGIPGISVRLIGKRTMLDYAVTGPDGSYRFSTIPTGDYSGAEFLLPDGYSCTLPGLGSDASPTEGAVAFAEGGAQRQTLNAGFVGSYLPETPAAAYGWILGTTWSDDDQNGVRDESYGMTDVEVSLLDAGGDVVASARTGYHDRYTSLYLFGPLLPGEYSLAFAPPDGYIFTSPGQGSHADPVTGTTAPFVVGGGDIVIRDAGLIPAPAPTLTAPPGSSPGGRGSEVVTEDETGGAGDGADEEQEDRDDEAAGGEKKGDADDTADDEQKGPAVTDKPQDPDGEAGDTDDAGDKHKKIKEDDGDKPGRGEDKDRDDDSRSGADRSERKSR